MRSELRDALQIPPDASPAEAARICGEYYAVYRGVYENCGDPLARSLAQERIRLLETAAAEEGIPLSAAPVCRTDRPQEILPGATEAWLSGCKGRLTRSQYEAKLRELESMPESAEKHYLMGCIRLNAVNYGANTLEDVAVCFDRALALDGDNVAYRLAVRELKNAKDAYSAKLEEVSEQAKDAHDKEIHDVEAQATRQKVLEVLKTVGKGVGAALAAIAAGVAVVFAAICDCADGC